MATLFTFNDIKTDLTKICTHLRLLVDTPGPTRCVAKLLDNFDPRINQNEEFFMFQTIQGIIDEFNKEIGVKIHLKQHNGNIIIAGGFDKKPTDDEIKDIPITLASHADEISFLVTKKGYQDDTSYREVLPLCATKFLVDQGFIHKEVEIYGFRNIEDIRKFVKVGVTSIFMKLNKEKKPHFFIRTSIEMGIPLLEGDIVIQKYDNTDHNLYNLDTIFHCKALDDRIGILCDLYTIFYLTKYTKYKSKAILVGDEEGVPSDTSWARLVNPTFNNFCRKDGIILICDGIDGFSMKEFPEFKRVHEALIIPYTSDGKGGGDHGLFSILRDNIIPKINHNKINFKAVTCTDYTSRSLDPKIMDNFPLIGFIDWSNGPVHPSAEDPEDVLDEISKQYYYLSKCHVDESVSIRQVLNIIGTNFYAFLELHKIYN